MADAARAARLADRIKVIVAQALERRIKDPRLGFVTVTDARVTNDLQHATLYYTVYGDEEQREETARALESAKGILRSEVGRNITAKSVVCGGSRYFSAMDFASSRMRCSSARPAASAPSASARCCASSRRS